VSIGYVVHLNYQNPWLSPFDEFQRFKQHPDVRPTLEGGTRLSYGARAITEGGLQSVPRLPFPGGALIGCSAGFVNLPRIKGSHNAMKTGMIAAECVAAALAQGRSADTLDEYQAAYEASWVHKDLALVRNVKPLLSKFGTILGLGLGGIDMWCTTLFGGWSPFGTQKHGKSDAQSLLPASECPKIDYPKPDGVISFDKLSSVFLSNTNHEENQPIHLKVKDLALQKVSELDVFGGPSNRYCPAGVYEWVEDKDGQRFQINAQNCVHCKTCDIKDPNQNITWTTPQGGEGPIYQNM
jgi:electron-transferring-flavoprotein dehydrogenase